MEHDWRKKESSPREWKGDLQTSEQKREESSFLCAEYSTQQDTAYLETAQETL